MQSCMGCVLIIFGTQITTIFSELAKATMKSVSRYIFLRYSLEGRRLRKVMKFERGILECGHRCTFHSLAHALISANSASLNVSVVGY